MGVLQYHLRRLEKDQLIVSRRRGLYKRFYKKLDFEAEEQEILGVALALFFLAIVVRPRKDISKGAI